MNNWIITGRLGKDAEVKSFNDGSKLANINIAIDMQKKNANGTYEKATQWVSGVMSNPNDKLLPYLTKGTMILAEGRPKARAYMKDGAATPLLEMQVLRIELLSSQNKANKGGDDFEDLPFNK